jgi:hypothetical protein
MSHPENLWSKGYSIIFFAVGPLNLTSLLLVRASEATRQALRRSQRASASGAPPLSKIIPALLDSVNATSCHKPRPIRRPRVLPRVSSCPPPIRNRSGTFFLSKISFPHTLMSPCSGSPNLACAPKTASTSRAHSVPPVNPSDSPASEVSPVSGPATSIEGPFVSFLLGSLLTLTYAPPNLFKIQ